jgi:RNA polymerase sigma factor (sigma-70 family)
MPSRSEGGDGQPSKEPTSPFRVTRPATTQERSRDALASVFLASYRDCLRFALGMLGDRSAGEEAVQDAFLRLWARPPLLNDPLAAKAYVFRTIVNMGRSRQRRDAHRRVLEPAVADRVDDRDIALSVDIRMALLALPTRRRACVLMRYVLDYTERETADALGVSIGTVKSQTHKALRQLREPLADATGREGVASHES